MAGTGLSENVLFRLHRGEAEMLQDEIASFRVDPADFSAAIQGALTLCSNARAVCRWAWKAISENRVSDSDQLGRGLEQVLGLTQQVLRVFQEMVRSRDGEKRTTTEEAESLVQAFEDVQRLREDFLEHWPWLPTAHEAAEAEAEYQRGEAVPLEEAFAEVAGMGKAEWLQKVAAS